MGDHYPEFKARSVFLNFPVVFSALWNAFSIFVPAPTRAKMAFVGEGDYQSLFDIVDPAQLPVSLGGFGAFSVEGTDFSSTTAQVFTVGPLSSTYATCQGEAGRKIAFQIRVFNGDCAWKLQIDDVELAASCQKGEEPTFQDCVACESGEVRLDLSTTSYWSRITVICRMVVV